MYGWERVWPAINARRIQLGMSMNDLYRASKVSEKSFRDLRKKNQPIAALQKQATICQGLDWTPDSIDRLLRGAEPIVVVYEDDDTLRSRELRAELAAAEAGYRDALRRNEPGEDRDYAEWQIEEIEGALAVVADARSALAEELGRPVVVEEDYPYLRDGMAVITRKLEFIEERLAVIYDIIGLDPLSNEIIPSMPSRGAHILVRLAALEMATMPDSYKHAPLLDATSEQFAIAAEGAEGRPNRQQPKSVRGPQPRAEDDYDG